MKITLNKTSQVNPSKDNHVLPAELTPQVAGGTQLPWLSQLHSRLLSA